ncbi:MAG TPA: hypothetical protein VGG85_03040 [Terracidiphilus sp.]|jgi:hypothetical protein
MLSQRTLAALAFVVLPLSAFAQVPHPHHPRYPNAPFNDPQLQIPADQAQSCFTPEGTRSAYEQFQQFDSFPQPASRGYLCINVPPGKTFVIDHLFAEADYDTELPAGAEWYLNKSAGGYELMTAFHATRSGSVTGNPHYVLSESVRLAVNGGSRVTLIMHNYYVNNSNSISETPGTASLLIDGHWE